GHSSISTASRITTLIRTGKLHLQEAAALLRAADAGIHSVRLNQDHIPEHAVRMSTTHRGTKGHGSGIPIAPVNPITPMTKAATSGTISTVSTDSGRFALATNPVAPAAPIMSVP
ncbi:hypothetical protein ACGLFO_10180, partial [Corynebacterium hesseae]